MRVSDTLAQEMSLFPRSDLQGWGGGEKETERGGSRVRASRLSFPLHKPQRAGSDHASGPGRLLVGRPERIADRRQANFSVPFLVLFARFLPGSAWPTSAVTPLGADNRRKLGVQNVRTNESTTSCTTTAAKSPPGNSGAGQQWAAVRENLREGKDAV